MNTNKLLNNWTFLLVAMLFASFKAEYDMILRLPSYSNIRVSEMMPTFNFKHTKTLVKPKEGIKDISITIGSPNWFQFVLPEIVANEFVIITLPPISIDILVNFEPDEHYMTRFSLKTAENFPVNIKLKYGFEYSEVLNMYKLKLMTVDVINKEHIVLDSDSKLYNTMLNVWPFTRIFRNLALNKIFDLVFRSAEEINLGEIFSFPDINAHLGLIPSPKLYSPKNLQLENPSIFDFFLTVWSNTRIFDNIDLNLTPYANFVNQNKNFGCQLQPSMIAKLKIMIVSLCMNKNLNNCPLYDKKWTFKSSVMKHLLGKENEKTYGIQILYIDDKNIRNKDFDFSDGSLHFIIYDSDKEHVNRVLIDFSDTNLFVDFQTIYEDLLGQVDVMKDLFDLIFQNNVDQLFGSVISDIQTWTEINKSELIGPDGYFQKYGFSSKPIDQVATIFNQNLQVDNGNDQAFLNKDLSDEVLKLVQDNILNKLIII